jgi:hypothetical protein
MTNYYDNPEEFKARGIDYSLTACLEYNPQPFAIEEVEKVLAVWEGENDGDDWRWVLKMKKGSKGKFVFLQGGCDYTGWDCQSWAKSDISNTALKAAEYAKTGPTGATWTEAVTGMGLGRMLNALSGSYMDNTNAVYDSLVKQIKEKKNKTWRENKEEEFKNDLPKIV